MANDLRRLAQMVYNMNTVKRVSRIRMLAQAVTEATSTSFNLLTCDDDPNYDLATDGTNVAEVEPGCKIIAIQLHMTIVTPANRTVEWVLYKDPDGVLTAAGATIATLYAADVEATRIVMRKNSLTAGHAIGTDRTGHNSVLNVPGRTLARSARLADGDVIRLTFTDDGGGTGDCSMYLRGRIITRGP